MKKFFKSPWLLLVALVIYMSVLGPALMSAPSTFAVLLNFVILVLLGIWLYRTVAALLFPDPNKSDAQASTSTSTNKE